MRGDNSRQTFIVEIAKAKSVFDLKHAIKERYRPRFNDILADSLDLWKALVPINKDLKEKVEALNPKDGDSLDSREILSNIFSDLEKKSVHIIIDRPHLGEL